MECGGRTRDAVKSCCRRTSHAEEQVIFQCVKQCSGKLPGQNVTCSKCRRTAAPGSSTTCNATSSKFIESLRDGLQQHILNSSLIADMAEKRCARFPPIEKMNDKSKASSSCTLHLYRSDPYPKYLSPAASGCSRADTQPMEQPDQRYLPTCLTCKTPVTATGCRCEEENPSGKLVPPIEEATTPCSSILKSARASKSVETHKKVGPKDEASFKEHLLPQSPTNNLTQYSSNQEKANSRHSNEKGKSWADGNGESEISRKGAKPCCRCSLDDSYFPSFPEDFIEDVDLESCRCSSETDLKFPEFPDDLGQTISSGDLTEEELSALESEDDGYKGEESPNGKACPCSDRDNTIIILNVSKCNTAETVEKIVRELNVKVVDSINYQTASCLTPEQNEEIEW